MKYIIISLLVLIFGGIVYAQNPVEYKGESINYVDENNNKQGVWKLYSADDNLAPHGSVYLECKFKDNIIDGIVKIKKRKKTIIEITPHISHEEKASFIAFRGNGKISGYIVQGKKGIEVFDSGMNELPEKESEWIKTRIEFLPLYYGGTEKLKDFIKDTAKSHHVEGERGRIMVKYVVDSNGFVQKVQVAKKIDATADPKGLLDKEAIRVVKSFPRMQPGFQGYRFVKVSYVAPINFR
ncbi:hypothetical protein E9993_19745 [Labilibacter sediminis]|nr:hypothetical protein E9993_19745 [Labilibacter sediminis]